MTLIKKLIPFFIWISFFIILKYFLFFDWKSNHILFLIQNVLLPFIYIFPFYSCSYYLFKDVRIRHTASVMFSIFIVAFLNFTLGHLSLFVPKIQLIVWSLFLFPEIFNKFSLSKLIISNVYNFFKIKGSRLDYFSHLLMMIILLCLVYPWTKPGESAILPPIGFDLSLSHLSLVKNYIANQEIFNPWWVRGIFIPQVAHLNYIGGILWSMNIFERADLYASFFSTLCFAFCVIIYYEYNSEKIETLIFALLLISFPIVKWHLSTAYLDALLMLIIFACFIFFLNYLKYKEQKFLYFLFFSSGIAFSVKNFSAVLFTPLFLYLIYKEWFVERVYQFKKITLGFIFFLIPFIIFYIHNLIYNGSLLFPYKFNPQNSLFWDDITILSFKSAINFLNQHKTFLSWLGLPFVIATSKTYSDSPGFELGFGVFIPWIILLIFSIKECKSKKYIVTPFFLIINAQMYLWYLASPIYRYFTSILPILCFAVILLTQTYLKRNYKIALIALLLVCGNYKHFIFPGSPPPISKNEVDSYLNKIILSYNAIKQLNEYKNFDSNQILYSLQDEGSWLYYNIKYLGDWFTEHHYGNLHKKDAEFLRYFFSSRKVSYLLHNGYATNLIQDFNENFGIYSKCFKKIITSNIYDKIIIYEINKDDPFCYNLAEKPHPSIKILDENFKIKEQLAFWAR